MEEILEDGNIELFEKLPSPREIKGRYPISEIAKQNVLESRKIIKEILDREDSRKLIFCGPCSIHNPSEALDYAKNLKKLAKEVEDEIYLVMRTYLEKPRSTIGWKGILYDPLLDNSGKVSIGIETARNLLLQINEIGLPCANEFLRTDLPQYVADLISWGAIGARTAESQPHRELASGLSMPIGIKNNTSGDIDAAIKGCVSAKYSHCFPGLDLDGQIVNVKTKGNKYCHVVLRGGNGHPNYYPEKVQETIKMMKEEYLIPNIVVDCSHANSQKVHENQIKVARNVLTQLLEGNNDLVGIMLESNIHEGKQDFPKNPSEITKLKYGVSITDSCISWEQTESIIREYFSALKNR